MKRARTPVTMPHVPSFECGCGKIHRGGKAWCDDCTRAGISARTIRPRRPSPDKVRLRSQVLALLQEGAALMPPGSQKRVAWVDRVNALITEQKDVA